LLAAMREAAADFQRTISGTRALIDSSRDAIAEVDRQLARGPMPEPAAEEYPPE
jgi:hypothetical protein